MLDTMERVALGDSAVTNSATQTVWPQGLAPDLGPPVQIIQSSVLKPQPFRARAYLRCLTLGHDMVLSRSHPGRITCRRCRIRRTY